MPVGINLRRIIAVSKSATSPKVGPVTNDITPFMPPNKDDADAVPAKIAVPPEITVIKALAMYITPMLGRTPVIGANKPPASPETAAPSENVTMYILDVDIPKHEDISAFCMVARATSPREVYLRVRNTAKSNIKTVKIKNNSYPEEL